VHDLEVLFALMFAAVVLVRAADRLGIPYPLVLVLGGLGLAFVPAMPVVELESEVVLLLFVPPLLASAGWDASPRELWAESRALGLLALALVLVTMIAVAVPAHALVDGLSWPAAFMLGAVVAPTDAVAAVATFASVRVPERVRLLVQGESLINDATGLTAFRVALGATAGFSLTHAFEEFVLAAAGGALVGVAVAWVALPLISRQPDVMVSVLLTVLAAYASYVAAEAIHASGILAAAIFGVYSGWRQPEFFDAATRLTAGAFWGILVFSLEALLFVLLGLQLEAIVDDVEGATIGWLLVAGVILSAVAVAVRLAFALLPLAPGLSLKERVIVGWCGMRGAISLAAALSIGAGVDGRAEVLFLTFIVILVTLVGQGLTLPALVRALKLPVEAVSGSEEALARRAAAEAALARLDELDAEGRIDDELLQRMRRLFEVRARRGTAFEAGPGAVPEKRLRLDELRRDLYEIQRGAILALRDQGVIGQDVQRAIERELDLEEARLST
jgi:Na+/H+ antiporter